MIGLKTSLAAFSLLMAISPIALAQDVVPGGWSGQFGYQSLGAPGFDSDSGFGPGAASYGGGAGDLASVRIPGDGGSPVRRFRTCEHDRSVARSVPWCFPEQLRGLRFGDAADLGRDRSPAGGDQKTVRRAKRR